MTNEKILEVINLSLNNVNSKVSLYFDSVGQEDAEVLIGEISKKLKRTYQFVKGNGSSWYEIVNHNEDKLEVVVFIN